MTVQECYEQIGGNYDDVMSRLRTDERVIKFLGKVAEDKSFALLEDSLKNRNMEEAFRAAHTLKGVCMNLSLTRLYESSHRITEELRGRTEYDPGLEPLFEQVRADYTHTIGGIRELLG